MLSTSRRGISVIPTNKPPKIKAIILDLSGTLIDPHCIAPARAFVKAFEKMGVSITVYEARGPMGCRKDVHIRRLLDNPKILDRWIRKYNSEPSESDFEQIYNHYRTVQVDILKECSFMISGAEYTCRKLQERGIRLGLTTGFCREQVDLILRENPNIRLDSTVAGDDLPDEKGVRPLPHMIFRNMKNLGIVNPLEVIKVDDTTTGIQEGTNAGTWTVGVYNWSTYTNVDSMEHWFEMNNLEQHERRMSSRERLLGLADYVVPTITYLPSIVDRIEAIMRERQSGVSTSAPL